MQGETKPVIRPTVAGDVEAIVRIAILAWEPIYASFRELLGEEIFKEVYPSWQAEKERQIRDAHSEDSRVESLVEEVDGEISGFVTWVVYDGGRVAEIGNNAVLPERQGRGTATRLYNTVIERLRDRSVAVVCVTTGLDGSHAPARSAYKKAGFGQPKPMVTYYRDLR